MPPDTLQQFEDERARLFSIGYRMLGSLTEAEDAVQDCWLRWQGADSSAIRTPAAWLTTAMTRLCIDRLRAAKTVRETYVGPWLPEPVVEIEDPPPDRASAPKLPTMETDAAVASASMVARWIASSFTRPATVSGPATLE